MQRLLCPHLLAQLTEIEEQICQWENLLQSICPEIDMEELLLEIINQKISPL